MAMADQATVVGTSETAIYRAIKAGGTDKDGALTFSVHNYGSEPVAIRFSDWGVDDWARIAAGKSATFGVRDHDNLNQIDTVYVKRASDAIANGLISFAVTKWR